MSYWGRSSGLAIAAVFVSTVAALGLTPQSEHVGTAAIAEAAVCAAAALPLGWLLGRKYDMLKRSQETDWLTGVHSRRFIESTAPKLLAKAERARKKVTLLMIDVNDFKEVNDRFGHQHGDSALRLIARALKDCSLRGEIVARWGGDEFVMVCPYADEKQVEKIIRRHKEKLVAYSPQIGPTLSVSVGSACFPEDGGDLAALMQTADKRMYEGKTSAKRTPPGADAKQA